MGQNCAFPEAEVHDDPPVLSVLLVGYNSLRFIRDCLEAVARHISVAYEVIFLDNASSDGTAEYILKNYPTVHFIASSANLGFAGGNNVAAQHARGKYLLLLNVDTILLTDIRAGIQVLEDDPSVGVVGARMYDAHGTLKANTGHFPVPWRLWKFTSQWMNPLDHPYGNPAVRAFRCDWVEGSFLLCSREKWQEVDGMDANAFMYVEDVEFCAHIFQLLGLVTVQCSKLMYQHFTGYSYERMAYLYAGFRRFHASCSTPSTLKRAEFVLRSGLIPRIVFFGMLSHLTNNPEHAIKFRVFRQVLREWSTLAPRPSSRRPLIGCRKVDRATTASGS